MSKTQISLHLEVPGSTSVSWFPVRAGAEQGPFGCIYLGEVTIYLSPESLDRLANAVGALQAERDRMEEAWTPDC